MNPDELEEIKKSYIFNVAKDVTPQQMNNFNKINKKDIVNLLEQYIKQNYPQYWNQYMEGKLYSNSSEIIDNLLNTINKLFNQNYKQNILNNSNFDKETKQLITNLLDNQYEAVNKLNKLFSNIHIDTNPIKILLLSLFLHSL